MHDYIIAARTAQGYADWENSTPDERLDVVNRWEAIQLELMKGKDSSRHGSIQDQDRKSSDSRRPSFDDRKSSTKEEMSEHNPGHRKGSSQYPEETLELPA